MADVVFILVTAVFFGLCVAYVRGLDRLVRTSEEGEAAMEATQ
ncbi:MAG TPA: potassium transporter Trk [Acidimicrobiales bacterium]|nr:potassium transporter Trk [Acidimicrobiales bacterium]